jgi:hypothetical protein
MEKSPPSAAHLCLSKNTLTLGMPFFSLEQVQTENLPSSTDSIPAKNPERFHRSNSSG